MNGLFGKIVGAINKDQTPGYTLGESVPSYDVADVWTLFRATSRDAAACSALVFLFDPARSATVGTVGYGSSSSSKTDLARAGVSQIKRLKHPDILQYRASAENADGSIFIATEPATPLATVLASQKQEMNRESIQWGLYTISRALGFLHQSGLIHGRVNAASIFVTPNGDWKLGGLEAVTQHAAASSLGRHVSLQPAAYQSPEFANGNWQMVATSSPGAVDSWSLGCLMFHCHSGSLSSPDQLRKTQSIPKQLITAYQKLLASNPSSRAPAGQLPNHPYFKSSKFVELNLFVENLALKGELEREAFLTKLPSLMDRLPDGFCTFKILPMVSDSIMTGNAAQAAFATVVKMKERLSDADFSACVVKAHAVKWYSTTTLDRNVKVEMLAKIDLFAKHFDSSTVNSAIFPAMTVAMQDNQSPALRDAAVKSVLHVASILNDKNLNSALMTHFAKLQVDPEPAIRTNTTVCLGRLASRLNQATRQKVLIAAFLRSLKDPFPPARAAGANALLLTADLYKASEVATRILPSIMPLTVDESADVRALAFKLVSTFLPLLEKNHEKMNESAKVASEGIDSSASSITSMGRSSSMGLGGLSNGVGWGLSSFSSMTAALLPKSESSTAASRAASGGISSDDFKNLIPNSAASNPGLSAKGDPKYSGSLLTTTVDPPLSSSSKDAAVKHTGSVEEFGAFEHAGDSDSQQLGTFGKVGAEDDDEDDDNDDDDDDGWGDMNVKVKNEPTEPGKNEDDDILALLGPPVGSRPPLKPVGAPSRTGLNANTQGSNFGVDGSFATAKSQPRQVRVESQSTPTLDKVTGPDMSRRGRKKSTGDDWEALLSGDSTAPKRRAGLGATRR